VNELSTYSLEVLRNDKELNLYRGRNEHEDFQILVLSPAMEHPEPETLRRLQHAYSFKEELDPAWAALPIAIARHWDRPVLVLGDPGGVPLDQLLGQPLGAELSLRLAVSLSNAIGHLHQRGVVHKDIKPANILTNPDSGRCWLIGFGIASRLPRERQSAEALKLVAGTLAYMAPEQTGRMNRSIDSRSDLYSLGVTLYEVLTVLFRLGRLIRWNGCTATSPESQRHCASGWKMSRHLSRQSS
jgi:serine/threonine protein kinase